MLQPVQNDSLELSEGSYSSSQHPPVYLCRSFRQAVGCILWGRSRGSCPPCSYTGSCMASERERTRPYLKHQGSESAGRLQTRAVHGWVIQKKRESGRESSRTDTGSGGEVSFVAHVAVADEGADGVDALAVPTRILQHLALVDVCQQRGNNPLPP